MKQIIWRGRSTLIAETDREINIGMSIFNRPTTYTMLFPLQGRYGTFTMEGVSFPLDVTFYSRDWRVIERFIAYPNMRDRYIPQDTWWMYEVPYTHI